ncbi:MAG: hypothetical protein WC955_01025 [Elusimicrobiota bacterium]
MKINKNMFIFAVMLILLLCETTNSAVPLQLNYQGRYRENGVFITSTRKMVFKLTNNDGATVYWNSGVVSVSVEKGLFSYQLDCSNVAWSDNSVMPFLEIYVGPASATTEGQCTVLSPREQIMSDAYTFYAASAAYSSKTGVGTTGYIARFTSQNTLGNSIIYDDGTNAGIGTTTPAYKLDVAGTNSTVRANYGINFGTQGAVLDGRNQLGSIELGPAQAANNTPFIDFHYGLASSQDYNVRIINDASNRLSLTAGTVKFSGNVVFSTNTANDKLDMADKAIRFTSTNYSRLYGGQYGLRVSNSYNATGSLRLGEAWANIGALAVGDDLYLFGGTGKGVGVTAGAVDPYAEDRGVYVNSSNDTGIGTTNPGANQLKVKGSLYATGNVTVTSDITASDYVRGTAIGCRVTRSAVQSMTQTTGNWRTIAFDSEIWDPAGNFSNPSFRAPVAGWYLMSLQVQFVYTTANTGYGSILKKNDNAWICYGFGNTADSSGNVNTTSTKIVKLAANDVVEALGIFYEGKQPEVVAGELSSCMSIFLLKAE